MRSFTIAALAACTFLAATAEPGFARGGGRVRRRPIGDRVKRDWPTARPEPRVEWMELGAAEKLAAEEGRALLVLFTSAELEARGVCAFASNASRRAVRESKVVPAKVLLPEKPRWPARLPAAGTPEALARARELAEAEAAYAEAREAYESAARRYGAERGPTAVFASGGGVLAREAEPNEAALMRTMGGLERLVSEFRSRVGWMDLAAAEKLAAKEGRVLMVVFTSAALEARGGYAFASDASRRAVRESKVVPAKILAPEKPRRPARLPAAGTPEALAGARELAEAEAAYAVARTAYESAVRRYGIERAPGVAFAIGGEVLVRSASADEAALADTLGGLELLAERVRARKREEVAVRAVADPEGEKPAGEEKKTPGSAEAEADVNDDEF